jgi:hypothetical protein
MWHRGGVSQVRWSAGRRGTPGWKPRAQIAAWLGSLPPDRFPSTVALGPVAGARNAGGT